MDKAALAWLVFGLLCAVAELLTPVFGFVLVGAAAVVSSAFAASGYGLVAQLIAFAVGTTIALTVFRTRIMSKLAADAPGVPSRTEKLVGRSARVTEAIDPVTGVGRVLADGHDWAALAEEPLAVGVEVRVEGADGIRLRVRRA
jgi:membrane protein implicated in regulation of membrane protease activity